MEYRNQKNEDIVKVVIDISKVVGVNFEKYDISIAHRMPKHRSSHRKTISQPPAIIATFVNKDLRNIVYIRRSKTRYLIENDFPVTVMTKLNVNENLTQVRKKLLWSIKQKAKELGYDYIWTLNGRIYVRKDSKSESTAIF